MNRDFRFYLASRFCAGTAMTMFRAAISWHVFALSSSAFHLGLVGLVQFIPALGLTLVGGAVADTYDRRRVMMLAQGVPLLASSALYLVTAQGLATLGLVYLTVFVESCAYAFDSPSRSAFLPTIVSREYFPRAVTIASTNQALAFVTGPALGGFVIAGSGIEAAYLTQVVLITTAVVGLTLVRARQKQAPGARVRWIAIKEGLAYVRSHQVVLGCMTLDMFAVIFGGATALLPIYATEILHVGPRGYGLLSASLELGALMAALVMILRPPIVNAGRVLLGAVAVFGLATVLFGLSRWFPLSVAAYMVVGMADQVSVVLRSTIIQLTTPDELRGRVSSINFIFIGASNQIGAIESGFVAAATNAVFAVVSGGLGCVGVVALVAAKMPLLREYRIERR